MTLRMLRHRLMGCRYTTSLYKEQCAVCGTLQGDWILGRQTMTDPMPVVPTLADLVDVALDAAKARLESDGCDCGDHNDPPCALCLVERAIDARKSGSVALLTAEPKETP